ncbi:MAG TPA: amidase, partial [Gemmatimonadales bacterium]|jgi:amidase
MDAATYVAHDGLGLAALVRAGEVTPGELVEAAIAQIERTNPKLNAVVHELYDDARRAVLAGVPDGPFSGVPFLIKDLLTTYGGAPMTVGSRFLLDFVPNHDSELVRRYKHAGLLILGKTNTPEFGLTPYTEPEAHGPCRNPWDLERTPGGSSGGSAAAVSAGMVPLAGGNDGGGSIRIPASCCGLFGLKPTRGRTPLGPDHGEVWQGCVVEGVLTRSVRDSAAALDATAGPDVGAPYVAPSFEGRYLDQITIPPGNLRIACSVEPFLGDHVHPDVRRAFDETVTLLQSLGHSVEPAAPPVEREPFAKAFVTMLTGELRADLHDAATAVGRQPGPGDVEVETWMLGLLGDRVTAGDHVSAVRYLRRASRAIGMFFENYDILLTPTLADPPIKLGALRPPAGERLVLSALGRLRAGWALDLLGTLDRVAGEAFGFTPWTPVFNISGQPAMSVPLTWNAGNLPIGMHFVGRFGDEATLLRLAAQLEQARPWFDRRPPVG